MSNSSNDNRTGPPKLIEDSLRNISSFLRGKALPGKARLNRAASPTDHSSAPGSSGRGSRDGSGVSVSRGRSEQEGGYVPQSAAIQGRTPLAHQQLVQAASQLQVSAPSAAAATTSSQPSSPSNRPPGSNDTAACSSSSAATGPPGPEGRHPAVALSGSSSRGRGTQDEGSPADAGGSMGGAAMAGAAPSSRSSSSVRTRKFHKLLDEPLVDLDALRELAWSGIPHELRPVTWRLLLGYLPPARARQAAVLARKRREYADMVPQHYSIANSERSEDEIGALRQVSVDVPRTAPNVPFFHEPLVQKSLERLLYIWGIRHPASGYVQGMNDLVTPFLAVFLSEHLAGDIDAWSAADLEEGVMLDVEADCYWCLSKLLEGMLDHYTYAQPGIQRTVFRLKELMRKQHEPLVVHLEGEGIDFLQFAFRWVNCLLIREVPFRAAIRLWDTYLAEGSKCADFLVYVCASFLGTWHSELLKLEFQELMMFLQRLPTSGWGDTQIESVLSGAYVLRNTWDTAQSHIHS